MERSGASCLPAWAIGTRFTAACGAWTKNGMLARVFEALQQEQLIHVKIEIGSLDSTSIKVHPDGQVL